MERITNSTHCASKVDVNVANNTTIEVGRSAALVRGFVVVVIDSHA